VKAVIDRAFAQVKKFQSDSDSSVFSFATRDILHAATNRAELRSLASGRIDVQVNARILSRVPAATVQKITRSGPINP
jgi:hypothetical protein